MTGKRKELPTQGKNLGILLTRFGQPSIYLNSVKRVFRIPVVDTRPIEQPDNLPPDEYQLRVGLYDWRSGERLLTLQGRDFMAIPVVLVSRGANPMLTQDTFPLWEREEMDKNEQFHLTGWIVRVETDHYVTCIQ
jgi:hypothetical protein